MKQWRRPQRAALRAHPVPIHANAIVHMRAVRASGICRKFVEIPREIGNTHQNRVPMGWRSQSLDIAGAAVAQSPRSLAVISGSSTTARITCGPGQLHGRARHGAVRTEHAAIARLGPQHAAACRTFEEVDAGIERHRFHVMRPAERARELRLHHRHDGGGFCRHWGPLRRPREFTIALQPVSLSRYLLLA